MTKLKLYVDGKQIAEVDEKQISGEISKRSKDWDKTIIPEELIHVYKNQEFKMYFAPFDEIKYRGYVPENTYQVTIVTMIDGQKFNSKTFISYEFATQVKDYLDFLCDNCLKAAEKTPKP
jgi:hypothetical protein